MAIHFPWFRPCPSVSHSVQKSGYVCGRRSNYIQGVFEVFKLWLVFVLKDCFLPSKQNVTNEVTTATVSSALPPEQLPGKPSK